MDTTNNRVTLKIFVGFLLSPDIELRLNQNLQWKQWRIDSSENQRPLSETYFQEKKYIGYFLDNPAAPFIEIKAAEREITEWFSGFLQDPGSEALKFYVFSQIFII